VAERQIRHAWITAVVHAVGSALILVTTGVNIVLAAHYPLVSAGAILLLGFGIRRRSRVAAAVLLVAAITPALIKLALGALHPADLPAFPLAILYARGLVGTVTLSRRGGRRWDEGGGVSNAVGDEAPSPVLAAVIRRGDRYLLARRPRHKRHGGLWEFPGGKLERGESWLDTARRELREELGVGVTTAGAPVFRRRDPASSFEIVFVQVEITGEPECLEHEDLRWVGAAEMGEMELAPADSAFAAQLGGG
jgi:8-oxo-dGTP diphosphatase